jgi:negative regulator of flagellin synthesis FlgM
MRIEAYSQVQQLYNNNKVKKTKQASVAKQTDGFQMSKAGKEMQVAKQAVKSAPDVRSELTNPIKNKMQNGTYDVSNESFANRLLQKYEEANMI